MPTRPRPDLSKRDALIITAPGLEAVTRHELSALGLTVTGEEPGALSAALAPRDVMRANLHLRTASRVVIRLADFRALTFADVERHAKRVPWETVVAAGQRVRFRVTCRKSRLYHSGAVAQRLAEALAVRVPGVVPATSAADEEADGGEEELFVVRLFRDHLTLSADTSGELLHRRGYRQATAKAPLRETLAAAMLLGAGWDGSVPLVDPMCGSGTIAIEAAMIARRMAPGRARRFAFERWPGHDATLWRDVRAAATAEEREAAGVPIVASDRDAGAVTAATSNATRAGVVADVEVRRQSLSALKAPEGKGVLLVNPPYGMRVGEKAPLRNLFAQLGNIARGEAAGWRLGMLSADRDLERQVRLPFRVCWSSTNGGIPVRFIVAEVPNDGR
ncbi:MAG: class I SAM-dependent RNA methyltransferase [Gemmatimonadaceae bacterium]|nr:class I SAM-dependent RNA methyltransferase [Gemmatimonadaceae bacterium]